MNGSSPGTRTYVTSNDMLHHRSDCRRKKSYVKALTEFTGRDTARGCKRNGEAPDPPKPHLLWGWVKPKGLFRGQFRGFA